jgi:Na+-translocating ferredoxin:NAD+ oxidoreductase RnfG subunit
VLAVRAHAERFLTREEAGNICFPDADRFEQQAMSFTPDQVRAIESAAGTRVRNKGNRVALAFVGPQLKGVVMFDHVLGKHEWIDYAVAFNPAGDILAVEILEYRESHGGEIRGNKWRSQFDGKRADSTLALHEDIYNISGATISCRNVTEGVRRLAVTYLEVVRPRLLAFGQLPGAGSKPATTP